jgi:hypothetical protein
MPGGTDLVAYRVVEEMLVADCSAACTGVGLRFGTDGVCLDFVLARPLDVWPQPATCDDIGRFGGTLQRAAAGAGERIIVTLPLQPAASL